MKPLVVRITQLSFFLRIEPLLLAIALTGLFVQIWFDAFDVTIRSEDVLLIILTLWHIVPVLLTLDYRFVRHPLRYPLFLWCFAIALGIFTSLVLRDYDTVVQKNALVNGARLLLGTAVFFFVFYASESPRTLFYLFFTVILVVSLPTTAVALLQIAYWDNWGSISLPPILITFKESANQAPGREIFSLYLGNTQSHTWSGVLVFQALTVFLLARFNRRLLPKLVLSGYFLLLCLILVRISVRNSILGLGLAVAVIIIIQQVYGRYPLNKLIKIGTFFFGLCLIVALIVIFAPENYFIARIWQTLPSWENGRLAIQRGSNIYGRLDYSQNALLFFQLFPILGGGFGSFSTLSDTLTSTPAVHAHNSYLQAIAELGFIGSLFQTILIIQVIRYLFRCRKFLKYSSEHAMVWLFAVGGTSFVLFSALFSNTLWFPAYISLWMFSLGILARYEKA